MHTIFFGGGMDANRFSEDLVANGHASHAKRDVNRFSEDLVANRHASHTKRKKHLR